jgi:signal transduction histidine kinase
MGKARKSTTIQRKLISFLLFASLVPLAAVGFVKSFEFNENLLAIEKYKISATLTINQVAAKKMMDSAGDSLMDILYDPAVKALFLSDTPGKLDSTIKKARESLPGSPSLYTEGQYLLFSRLSLIDSTGREIMAFRENEKGALVPTESSGHLDLSGERAFKKIEKLPPFQWTPLQPSSGKNEPTLVFSTRLKETPGVYLLAPCYSDRHFKGALIATLSPRYMSFSFAIIKRGEMYQRYREDLYLLSQDGEILYSSIPGRNPSDSTCFDISSEVPKNIEDRILSGFAGDTFKLKKPRDILKDWYNTRILGKPDDNLHVVIYSSLGFKYPTLRAAPGLRGTDRLILVVRAPFNEFYKKVNESKDMINLLLVAFTIVSITTGVFLSRLFLQPINEIIKGTKEITKDNLNYCVNVKTGDEFEDLAHHINTMVERLRENYDTLKKHNIIVEKTVEERTKDLQEKTRDLEKAKHLLLKAKEGIAIEKERLEAVLNSTKEGILMCQPSGEVVFSNRSCQEMFEIFFQPQDEKKQKNDAVTNPDLYPRDWNARRLISRRDVFKDPDRYLADLEGLLQDMNDKKTGQIIKVTPQLQIIDWFSAPVRTENGEVLGRIIAFRDVTKEKEVERMKDEFVSIVSHELRTPMTAINGSLSLVLDGTVGEINEDQQDLLETAKNNTVRLIRLINDILDISKIESGKIQMKSEPCDIYTIVKESLAGIQGFAEKYGVNAASELEKEIPPFLADRDRIIQVVTNLLSNAIKFSHRDGTVHTIVTREEEQLRVAVKDEGIGIPPEYLGKVFEKFQQVDSSAVREKGGTGLGLPICKAIIEEHGGTMWVESEPGKGSSFIFIMPLRVVEAASDEAIEGRQ